MACERYRDALTDVAAGAPAPGAVEAHLATCEACRAELEALRRALAVADAELAGLLGSEPSPGLAVRIRQAVADSEPSPAWRFGWLWPATAAAATLLVALAVWVGRPPAPGSLAAVDVAGHGVSSRGASGVPGAEGSAVTPAEIASTPPGSAAVPTSPDPAAPGEVRRAGGSLGTRRDGVPRDDRVEVLVPPGEQEALLRLVELVHRDRLSLAGLSAAGPSSPDLAGPEPVDIPLLEIVPLDRAESPGT